MYRVNNWYVMTPRALFWHLIETNYILTVNHFKQKFGFIKRVDKGEITTVKDLGS